MRAISKEKFMDIYMKPTKEEYEKLQPCLTYEQIGKVLEELRVKYGGNNAWPYYNDALDHAKQALKMMKVEK